MPGHDVDGGFRPVLNVYVCRGATGQGGKAVTSWDDMRADVRTTGRIMEPAPESAF